MTSHEAPPSWWLSKYDAARVAGVHPKTISKWWKVGKIRGGNFWDDSLETTRTWIDPDSLDKHLNPPPPKEKPARAPKPQRVKVIPPGRCLYGKCERAGKTHHWGLGFRFCEDHMPALIDLEHGRLRPTTQDRGGECRACGQHKWIKGRGLCSWCYESRLRDGTIDEFPPIRRRDPAPGVRECKGCGEWKAIRAREMCSTCYEKARVAGEHTKFDRKPRSRTHLAGRCRCCQQVKKKLNGRALCHPCYVRLHRQQQTDKYPLLSKEEKRDYEQNAA